jgi:hypothetical protein
MSRGAERIAELCQKVLSISESSPDFEPAIVELRRALHEHLIAAKDSVADLARNLASSKKNSAG